MCEPEEVSGVSGSDWDDGGADLVFDRKSEIEDGVDGEVAKDGDGWDSPRSIPFVDMNGRKGWPFDS